MPRVMCHCDTSIFLPCEMGTNPQGGRLIISPLPRVRLRDSRTPGNSSPFLVHLGHLCICLPHSKMLGIHWVQTGRR